MNRDRRLEGGNSDERMKKVQINFSPSTNDGMRKEESYKQKGSRSLKLRRVCKGRAEDIFGRLN